MGLGINSMDHILNVTLLSGSLGSLRHLHVGHLGHKLVLIQISILLRRRAVERDDDEVVVLQPPILFEDSTALVLEIEKRVIIHLGLPTDVEGRDALVHLHPVSGRGQGLSRDITTLDVTTNYLRMRNANERVHETKRASSRDIEMRQGALSHHISYHAHDGQKLYEYNGPRRS